MLIDNLPDELGWFPPAYTFDSQVCQYPADGEPGISYFGGETSLGIVDCLLYRDSSRAIRGILNHYSFDVPMDPINQVLRGLEFWEKKGNFNIFIHPDCKRLGIATLLLDEAASRWDIDLAQQRYTEEGKMFIRAYVGRRRDANLRSEG